MYWAIDRAMLITVRHGPKEGGRCNLSVGGVCEAADWAREGKPLPRVSIDDCHIVNPGRTMILGGVTFWRGVPARAMSRRGVGPTRPTNNVFLPPTFNHSRFSGPDHKCASDSQVIFPHSSYLPFDTLPDSSARQTG